VRLLNQGITKEPADDAAHARMAAVLAPLLAEAAS
jgi:hypothetical protein